MFDTLLFFNATATTDIYTLSLHDALPIYSRRRNDLCHAWSWAASKFIYRLHLRGLGWRSIGSFRQSKPRSEEHTSELQSHSDLVCRLLLEKKKKKTNRHHPETKDNS